MAKKNAQNTRARIVEAAWQLFYEQGYEDTTVEEIIETSRTSKGSFYHYFGGKDALLSTLSDLFDQKYLDLQEKMDPDMPAMDKLLYLNGELFRMIENSVSLDLLARLLSTQLVTNGQRHLLDHKRVYYRLLRRIIAEGQERGQLSQVRSVNDMVKIYALCERALLYDWCLCGGEYPLREYAARQMPVFLSDFPPGVSSNLSTEKTP
ncbi:MAG TPA: TetR/AcrR family transcriptional regulator [Candidatus Evtepia faecigallinarum]|nr:TetR/AcrR family transcriptional regulator [Candidatus Evtepia faecigallinarum]